MHERRLDTDDKRAAALHGIMKATLAASSIRQSICKHFNEIWHSAGLVLAPLVHRFLQIACTPGDIKLENFMYESDKGSHIKIIDFGD